MSKLVKIAAILAIAAVAIAARQFASPVTDDAVRATAPAPSVSPSELMRPPGELPELKIENLI